jgi:hypothetical protein
MSRALAAIPLFLVLGPVRAAAQEPAEPLLEASQVESVDDLVKFVRQREQAVGSVSMQMESVGRFPDGSEFRTKGSLRVLGTTHFHARMSSTLGPDMETETETVRTPDGIWMRERDPVQGEVWLAMDRPTMERIDGATRALGPDADGAGFGSRDAQTPLGSAVLEDLGQQFDLQVRGPRSIDGQECWVVGGPLRPGLGSEDEPFGLGADQVDVLVRTGDGALLQMTQLRQGEPLMEVRITALEFDRPFDPASFRIEIPERVQWSDILEHPPARAQIERLLEDAREKGWVDPAGGETASEPAGTTPPEPAAGTGREV